MIKYLYFAGFNSAFEKIAGLRIPEIQKAMPGGNLSLAELYAKKKSGIDKLLSKEKPKSRNDKWSQGSVVRYGGPQEGITVRPREVWEAL